MGLPVPTASVLLLDNSSQGHRSLVSGQHTGSSEGFWVTELLTWRWTTVKLQTITIVLAGLIKIPSVIHIIFIRYHHQVKYKISVINATSQLPLLLANRKAILNLYIATVPHVCCCVLASSFFSFLFLVEKKAMRSGYYRPTIHSLGNK